MESVLAFKNLQNFTFSGVDVPFSAMTSFVMNFIVWQMLGYRDWLSFVFAKETIAKIPVEPMSWSIADLQDRFIWDCNSALHCSPNCADYYRDASHGHMAVLCASLHAPEQILVSPCPLSTSQAGCPLCNWGPLQSSVGGLLLDTVGGAISFLVSGMTARTAVIFFCFAVIKTVDDHCGLWLPGNIFHLLFQNNTAYHDIHHQRQGLKYNYSQPFFPIWDKLLGTHMPYKLVRRPQGGFEARLTKD
ncbi:Sphinganine C4-monooxygenase 1 [Vitis vinifera]|uniref:Sphinganine C4-monooxygenase 1 n=1 Tax=Vitis vinifera TaxID=29760 RepID=A0A438CHM3_VITVI|nr:Sphinganine C4-monooxygenase 1 [Vitis vinifera]